MLDCDELTYKSVAKKVVRAMLHVFLLCDLKNLLQKIEIDSIARGGVSRKHRACNLQQLLCDTSCTEDCYV